MDNETTDPSIVENVPFPEQELFDPLATLNRVHNAPAVFHVDSSSLNRLKSPAGMILQSSPATLGPKEVTQYLISKNYLLTALEFYAELCEDGNEIKDLKDFFSGSHYTSARSCLIIRSKAL